MTDDKNSPTDKIVGSTDGLELHALMGKIFAETKRTMSAAEMTSELNKRGWLPEFHTVIDIADEMQDWFGNKMMRF